MKLISIESVHSSRFVHLGPLKHLAVVDNARLPRGSVAENVGLLIVDYCEALQGPIALSVDACLGVAKTC